jgi:hypothetical protein
MSIKRLAVSAAILLASVALQSPAFADHDHYRSDWAVHHCREYGGVVTPTGCYISSKYQRKRLIIDEQAWENSHRDDDDYHHHHHHDDFQRDYHYYHRD